MAEPNRSQLEAAADQLEARSVPTAPRMTTTFSNPAGPALETAAAYTQGLLELLGDRDPLEVMRELREGGGTGRRVGKPRNSYASGGLEASEP